jgi:hypothetical protein
MSFPQLAGLFWITTIEDAMKRVMALLAFGLWTIPAFGASPDPKDLAIPPQEISKARELIRRLGSEVYREREEAQSDLAKMGRLARPALLEAATGDPDPEVRFRCSRLLPKAGAEDLKARVETFLADTESKYEHNLPGLKQFRKITGTDKESRDLFVEIIKSPSSLELLQMLDKPPAEAGRAISDRRMVMWSVVQPRNFGRIQPQQQVPIAEIACLLLAETAIPSKDIPRNNMWNHISGVMFVIQENSLTAINKSSTPHSEAYKRIIGRWLDSREDPMDLTNLAYYLGQNLRGFKETVPLLRRIVTTEGVVGYARAQALTQLIHQQQGQEEIDLHKSLMSNDTVATTIFFGNIPAPNQMPRQLQCLLRDVALANLIAHSGQQLSDYGYQFVNGATQNGKTINFGFYAFPNEETRNAAMVKFAFSRMKQVGKEPTATSPPTPSPDPSTPKK